MTSRGYFSSLTKEQEDNALLKRLAVPEQSYNRLSSLLSRLTQPSSAEDPSQLQSELEEEYVNFELAMIKSQNIRNVNEKEIQRYNQEKQVILEKSGQTQRDITALRGELEEAKLERGQKVQYDEFTRNLLKKTPKSRSEQILAIEKISAELQELETELSSYSTVWDARKATFDNILNNLEVLKREVEDEKEEQDRKEGMNEGSEHDEEEGQATGTQTPAGSVVKEGEERREREQSRDSGEVDEDAREQLRESLEERTEGKKSGDSGEVEMEDEDEVKMVETVETDSKMHVD